MTITLEQFAPYLNQEWDKFCEEVAVNATFLHTRVFLSHHGDRFKDESLVVRKNGKIVALLPAAISPVNSKIIVSHPGLTYGGLVHGSALKGVLLVEVLGQIKEYFAQKGFSSLEYRAIPYIYSKGPIQDDLHALFILGSLKIKCNLASVIDLSSNINVSSRRIRSLKKAQKSVIVSNDQALMEKLWEVVLDNLNRKFEVKPVHALEELLDLKEKFPSNIICKVGLIDGKVEAGVVVFKCKNLFHAQYIASSEVGYCHSALDAVFEDLIKDAIVERMSYFDFGTSNEADGRLNEGLYNYKSEYGAGGVAYEHYRLPLIK